MNVKTKLNFLAVLIFSLSCLPSLKAEPMAVFDGGNVDNAEVLENGAIAFYNFEMQRLELSQQILLGILRDKLIVLEEKKSGKKYNVLVSEFIDREFDKETAQKYKKFYRTDTLSTDNEAATARYNVENKFLVYLIKKYNVKFNLPRPEPPVVKIDTQNQPSWGPKDSKVTIIEYGDFECPYCKKMQTDIQRIRKEYSGKIRWVFIDFPLDFHRQSFQAHVAARCAGDQKHYFEYQQLLFQNAPQLDKKTLLNYASQLKLDTVKFSQCLEDKTGEKKKIIDANIEYGRKKGISGTPTLFINNKFYPGMIDYPELKEIIDREL